MYSKIKIVSFELDHINIGIWEKLDSIRDERLRFKATLLPDLFKAAFAEGTLDKYIRAWNKWVEWTKSFDEVNHCPADPFFVCIYFNDLVLNKTPVSGIISALCGIRWGHINAGFESPTDHPIVKLAFEGAKRLIGKTTQNVKEPFTAELIRELVSKFDNHENLMHLRFLIIVILGFAGFFRIQELLDIQIKHITGTKDSYEITVEKSKNDQYREGHKVYIAKTGKSTCPVHWLKKYLRLMKLEKPNEFLICRLAKTKKGHNVLGAHAITYPTARKTFLEHLEKVTGKDVKNYGLHSLRSGGATAASNNGVPARLIGKHGRWSANSNVKEKYIKDSKTKRLSVSKNLGI